MNLSVRQRERRYWSCSVQERQRWLIRSQPDLISSYLCELGKLCPAAIYSNWSDVKMRKEGEGMRERWEERREAELAAVTLEECCYETPQPGALILPEMILNHCPKPHTLAWLHHWLAQHRFWHVTQLRHDTIAYHSLSTLLYYSL